MARPRLPIDAEQVMKLARLGCTQDEIGDYFGCSRATIAGRFKREFELGRAASRTSLRRWQMKRARAGSDAMLIHLGKHMLGQDSKAAPPDSLEEPPPLDDDGNPITP